MARDALAYEEACPCRYCNVARLRDALALMSPLDLDTISLHSLMGKTAGNYPEPFTPRTSALVPDHTISGAAL
jgi:hypothetical protein